MAWDDERGGFNFYRTIPGAPGSWVWAGNSRHAWGPGTRSSGPFESHPTGNLLFKELKLPWVHWHSPKATMDRLDLPAGDDLANHHWFADKDGAYVFEESVARLAIERWNRKRIASVVEAATIEEPQQVLVRLLGAPQLKRLTVNLASSDATQPSLSIRTTVGLPESFFVDVDGLSGVLGLNRPPSFSIAASTYRDALAEFDVKLVNEDGDHPLDEGEERFERPGDTHFLFVIPERAFEDVDLVRRLVKPDAGTAEPSLGLITERLAGCLLMVDFPNPVFSERRASLLDHVASDPLPSADWAFFAQSLGDTIAAAGKGINPSEAEAEFAALWDLGNGWKEAANEQLSAYYKAVTARLASPDGFKDVFRLAEARRNRVREMPINEVALLLAQTAIPAASIAGLAMNPDGSVEERGEA
jgi:hypothetical protein